MTSEEKKEWAALQLRQKYAELGRLPLKEDYDEKTRSRIKAFLGPWPRALEAAGLKEPRGTLQQARSHKKKIRAEGPELSTFIKTVKNKQPDPLYETGDTEEDGVESL